MSDQPRRIAIIGGGSAGFIAAAYLPRLAPDLELVHVHDSSIPRIGVGEGTTPPFVRWIRESLGWGLEDLAGRALATHKDGILFEGWGTAHERYVHYFSPRLEGPAYHISADRLVDTLAEQSDARELDRHVTDVLSGDDEAEVRFADGTSLTVDVVFDARGFPADLTVDHLELSCVPTDRAAVRRGPVSDFRTATRAVARPHGWIFVIPLTEYTSYGYVHNSRITDQAELEHDFDAFMTEENVAGRGPSRFIRFPNFVHRTVFEERVIRLGNAASFVEPLEATALAMILYELDLAAHWLFGRNLGLSRRPMEDRTAEDLNRHLIGFVREIEVFIGWHYAMGAPFESPFWSHAVRTVRDGIDRLRLEAPEVIRRFDEYAARGAQYPAGLAVSAEPDEMDALESAGPPATGDYGGFLTPSFGKVGYGIGAFAAPAHRGGLPPAEPPITIAHRGASGHAPEHTLRSYELGLEMGADYIEQDLQMTADGVLVVLHDDTLDRTAGPAGGSGRVKDLTIDEIAGCDVGRWFNHRHPDRAHSDNVGARIPTLREVFERFGRGARYYIETKTPSEAPGMEEALIAELERAGLLPDSASDWSVLIQSFSPESLRHVSDLAPNLPLIQLIEGPGPITDETLARVAGYAVGIGPDRKLVDGSLVRRAHALGLVVHPWTVNEANEMNRLLDVGVDGVFTDFPDRFGRIRERRRP